MKLEDVWNQMKLCNSFEEFEKILDSERDEIIKEELEKLNTKTMKEIEIDKEFEFLLFNEVVIDFKHGDLEKWEKSRSTNDKPFNEDNVNNPFLKTFK